MKLLFCFGTRPEAIKMAPIIKEAIERGHQSVVALTGQHKDLITPFLRVFGIKVNYDLNVMTENQTLSALTSRIISAIEPVIKAESPDVILVQGDTTSAFCGALAGFYQKKAVAHVEAGLRTGDIYSPFPEEMNRVMVSKLATYHFCPTEFSLKNLKHEGIERNLYVTGNTAIDALRLTYERVQGSKLLASNKFCKIDFNKHLVLVTCHRRENFGEPLERICDAILSLSKERSDLCIVWPVHPNPQVKNRVLAHFKESKNVFVIEPLDYEEMVLFIEKSTLILTDSGGVQEEAPYFKKPLLVLRENTERQEGVNSGVTRLVGTDKDKILTEAHRVLNDEIFRKSFAINPNPFGDGFSSAKIIDILEKS